jgi:hypothetical protein
MNWSEQNITEEMESDTGPIEADRSVAEALLDKGTLQLLDEGKQALAEAAGVGEDRVWLFINLNVRVEI